ncbi:MAG: hypothetical protein RL119_824 [Actinomycetota bacterium]|jgi:hypothetical protein
MPLFLTEIAPSTSVDALLKTVQSAVSSAGGEFIEAQVTADQGRVFIILEADSSDGLQAALSGAGIPTDSLDPVRLVGADLAEVKRTRPASGYLVEWDIPSGITMDAYLARKKEKSPLYAQVPETTFQRTYVREDMVKCLCFYDAPDEAAVIRAREVVSTPIDRLHRLDTRDLS